MSERAGPLRIISSILLLLPMRLLLGGLFIFAAYIKLQSPQEFAFSINAFKIIDPASGDHLIKLLTFALPWAEGICGVLLVLGLFTRSAAALLSVQLLVFIAAIISVLARDMNVSCGCFGKYEWPCGGVDEQGMPLGISLCHVWRNTILLVPALLLTFLGGGVLALDWPRERRQRCEFAPAEAPGEG